MNDVASSIRSNPLRTRDDVALLFHQLSSPLKKYFTASRSRIHLGETNVHYGLNIAGMEAFSRVLWGLIPLTAGGQDSELWIDYLEGIRSGTDPSHEAYWGKISGTDQRMVEMAAFGYGLALVPEKIWEPLRPQERQNLYNWLNQINSFQLVNNNWQFFRILVNIGLAAVGMPYDQEKQQEAFDRIESYYLGDGWYSDGNNPQLDYYIPFAFHFYGLLYANIMREKDPERSQVYMDRAALFAKDFPYWFAADGSALPFGRSLTYRFAQAAFWGALALARVEALDWGVVKGMVLRHLRWWMQQPIFTGDGVLTIGYAYPNLMMAENYNSPGSPYWALKTLAVLALPEDHPLWMSAEQPLPDLEKIKYFSHPKMMICRNEEQSHVYALTSGQHMNSIHGQNDAKYAKFAYSNQFGFSIQKGLYGDGQIGGDSMLFLSEKDGYFRGRKQCEAAAWQSGALYSRWKPWRDVTVETWLVPVNEWHIRLHRIDSKRKLDTMEGGFSVPLEKYGQHSLPLNDISCTRLQAASGIAAVFPWGTSGVVNLLGDRTEQLVTADPNTNVLHASPAYIPALKGAVEQGVTWYGTAVFAHAGTGDVHEKWSAAPQLFMREESLPQTAEKIPVFSEASGKTMELLPVKKWAIIHNRECVMEITPNRSCN
ncbi:hypothetical protein SAMN05421736_11740 [Evansella caseinilytica]|uniref:DUF2264 domain-containing protein n=1 Tax=Evansella caseinilytica TaxID=1503961 RepID=A0A1H3U0Y4_9BACI|nr:DUF2264 domain-containing protein [Evansella caseinilytica]SDZ56002.1 hypothetical protein SAMN05421736_11740 [Evansella caseinilytica]